MSKRVQVILDEEEVVRFKAQARKESKSLSAWLREAGRLAVQLHREKSDLKTTAAFKKFFQESNKREKGQEPDWEDLKRLILEGYRGKGLS